MLSAWAFKLKFGYKIFLKGVEMSKFLNFKIALPVAILVMGGGSASAALNCTTQPTCTELGYSKSKVEGCESYVLCPFDTSYMACVKYGEGQCSNGYAKTVADCGTSGSSGWTLGTAEDSAGCYQCTGGWTLGTAEDSAGCYQCTAKTCPTGYTAGNYGVCLSGYKAEYHSTAYAGNTKCYRCVKDCPAGYSTSQLRICPSGQTLQEHATVKGCYGCVTLQCTDGYARRAGHLGRIQMQPDAKSVKRRHVRQARLLVVMYIHTKLARQIVIRAIPSVSNVQPVQTMVMQLVQAKEVVIADKLE